MEENHKPPLSVPNQEFDDIYDQLEKVEEIQGWTDPDSPTLVVGGSAGKINQLGDVDNIPKWSRNQAVALYYLNMINKITTQGSPRKGA